MCCGKQRRQLRTTGATSHSVKTRKPFPRKEIKRYFHAYFQYLGEKGIIVQGPVSGMRYRFERFGVVIPVDPRDRRSLATVSNLRQVQGPV